MTFAVLIGRVLAAILLVVAFTATACNASDHGVAVKDSAKAAKLTQCVEPKAFMRRNHMELIKHQRDVTVHEGIRATKHSLSACIGCHVKYDNAGKPVPVNAPKQFCNGCHEWLAVQPECFQCHSPVPQGPEPTNFAHTWPKVFGSAEQPVIKPAEPPAPVVVAPVVAPVAQPEPAPQVVAPVVAPVAQPEPAPQVISPVVAPVAQPEPAPEVIDPVVAPVAPPEPAPEVVVPTEPAPPPVAREPETH